MRDAPRKRQHGALPERAAVAAPKHEPAVGGRAGNVGATLPSRLRHELCDEEAGAGETAECKNEQHYVITP